MTHSPAPTPAEQDCRRLKNQQIGSVRKMFIGLNNIASQIPEYARTFNQLGVDTLTVTYKNKRIVDSSELDYVIEDRLPDPAWFRNKNQGLEVRNVIAGQLSKYIWNKAVQECDTFFFIWNSFAADFSDYATLKSLGKKIITLFVGDDVRWVPAMTQEFNRYGLPPIEYDQGYHNPGDLPVQKLQYLRVAERFSDVVYCHPGHAQLSLRPYFEGIVPIDLSSFDENSHQREHPLIVHAPSSSATKGTKYVLPVIERLREEGVPFTFELIQNLPYREALLRYRDADILIGQLLSPGGGKQEREALACGTIVLSSLRPEYPQRLAAESPIIDVNPDTLYEVLKAIILDHPRRMELAPKGRTFIDQHHDIVGICEQMIDLLTVKRTDFDYFPTFFRDHYVPENNQAAKLYNTYTNFVSSCDWYQAFIPPGERDGLRF